MGSMFQYWKRFDLQQLQVRLPRSPHRPGRAAGPPPPSLLRLPSGPASPSSSRCRPAPPKGNPPLRPAAALRSLRPPRHRSPAPSEIDPLCSIHRSAQDGAGAAAAGAAAASPAPSRAALSPLRAPPRRRGRAGRRARRDSRRPPLIPRPPPPSPSPPPAPFPPPRPRRFSSAGSRGKFTECWDFVWGRRAGWRCRRGAAGAGGAVVPAGRAGAPRRRRRGVPALAPLCSAPLRRARGSGRRPATAAGAAPGRQGRGRGDTGRHGGSERASGGGSRGVGGKGRAPGARRGRLGRAAAAPGAGRAAGASRPAGGIAAASPRGGGRARYIIHGLSSLSCCPGSDR